MVEVKPWLAADQLPDWHVKNIRKSVVPIEPGRSYCTEHGWQVGPGCSDCWDEWGPNGAPIRPEDMTETESLRAEVASLRTQLAELAQQNQDALKEFQAFKDTTTPTPNPNAPQGDGPSTF